MDTNLIVLFSIFGGLIILIIGYQFGRYENRQDRLRQENKNYLWSRSWKYMGDGFVQAKDETTIRPIYEAVERQRELDRISRLNLPKGSIENNEIYQIGSWSK